MCYTAQTQTVTRVSPTLDNSLSQNPALCLLTLLISAKYVSLFLNFQNEYVAVCCYPGTLRLPHCNAHCLGLVWPALEALLIVGFSILIRSTGTKLKEIRKGRGFSGSMELSSETSSPQYFVDARSLHSSEEADEVHS